jgi:pyruvate formate-lyase activating enzyme-like uncharacterized protein
MEAYHAFLNELVNKQTGDISEGSRIAWVNYSDAIQREKERDRIIRSFGKEVTWEFKHTKPWINRISEGCRLCGEGEWSCLFITGKCNGTCFYCPSPQDTDDLPTTQQLTFEDPSQYAFYLQEFGYKGSSFSGGEPLLVLDRVMAYLKAIRKEVSPVPYLWMYTNGILANRRHFQMLADAGLNEVRFDIGATGYSLEAVRKAQGIIPVITVEVPAVPERSEQLKALLPEMIQSGVSHVNLHQLRLTRHNAPRMLSRNYTYLHGEHPTVLESELTALDLIRHVKIHSLDIGVNYCGFQYKNRFQKAGYRKKMAGRVQQGQFITENGYGVTLYGTDKKLHPDQKSSMLQIRDSLRKKQLVEIAPGKFDEGMRYFNTLIFHFTGSALTPGKAFPGEQGDWNEPLLPGEMFTFRTAPATYPVIVPGEKRASLLEMINSDGTPIPTDPVLFRIWKFWFIEPGLRPYF